MVVALARRLRPILPQCLAIVRPADVELMRYFTDEGVYVVPCPDADLGIGHAIACGVVASATANGWVVLPADIHALQAETVAGIVGLLAVDAQLAAPRYRNVSGYPLGFHKSMREQLLLLDSDQSPHELMARHAQDLRYFDVSDAGIHPGT